MVVLGPRGIRQCCPLQLLICSQVILHCLAHVTLTKCNYHTYLMNKSVYQVDGKYQGYTFWLIDCPVAKNQIFLLCTLTFAIENTESWIGQSTSCKEDGPLFLLNNPNPPSRPACFSGIIRPVHCKEDGHKSSQKQTPSGDIKWWYQLVISRKPAAHLPAGHSRARIMWRRIKPWTTLCAN